VTVSGKGERKEQKKRADVAVDFQAFMTAFRKAIIIHEMQIK
jgi:hypothetical protein